MIARFFLFFAFASTFTGCVRNLEFPERDPIAASAPPPEARWQVGKIAFEPTTYPTHAQLWAKAGAQFREHLTLTLLSTPALAGSRAVDGTGAYIVDVVVDPRSQAGMNPGMMALGIAAETGTVMAFAGAGALVAKMNGTDEREGAALGTILSVVPALLVACLPPSHHVLESYEATVTIRRRADGQIVSERHLRSDWSEDFNLFGFAAQDALAGRAVADLERKIISDLAVVLAQLPAKPTLQPLVERPGPTTPPAPEHEGTSDDAPRRVTLANGYF